MKIGNNLLAGATILLQFAIVFFLFLEKTMTKKSYNEIHTFFNNRQVENYINEPLIRQDYLSVKDAFLLYMGERTNGALEFLNLLIFLISMLAVISFLNYRSMSSQIGTLKSQTGRPSDDRGKTSG